MGPREYKKLRAKAKPKITEVETAVAEERETYDFSKVKKDFNTNDIEFLYNLEFLKKTNDTQYEDFKESVDSDTVQLSIWNIPSMEEIAKKEDDRVKNVLSYKPLFAVEGIVTCHKCGCNKMWSYQAQTRGKDEGMTTTYVCSNCNFAFSSS